YFQAEDGIRFFHVTGVQTCALPISNPFTAGEKYAMSTAIAKNHMAEMKLLGMTNAFDRCVHEATRDQIGYTQLLDTLLQAEADYRQARKTGNRIKAARFTLRPSFEDF